MRTPGVLRVLLLLALLVAAPMVARAQGGFFALFADDETTTTVRAPRTPASIPWRLPPQPRLDDWSQTTDTWILYPLMRSMQSPTESTFAIYPLLSIHRDKRSGIQRIGVLWPLSTWSHQPEDFTARDRTSFTILPLWYSGSGTRKNGQAFENRYLIPFYWQGHQAAIGSSPEGRYTLVLPFYWQAKDARLVTPLFPARRQNFFAIWPFYGEFRGYWNRDLIEWVMWPLFVRSVKGTGDDRLESIGVVWPVFHYYRGGNHKGGGVWPLFGMVNKKGETSRAYWLWPLGRRVVERDKSTGEVVSSTTLFIPFYGRVRSEKIRYDFAFPVYGDLQMAGRRSRGWGLATYMQDDNLRTGIRTHRVLWFIGRWTTRIPIPPQFQQDSQQPEGAPSMASPPLEGGGVFPFYINRRSATDIRRAIVWPFYTHRVDFDTASTSRRTYLLPFFVQQKKTWHATTDAATSEEKPEQTMLRRFYWPGYREWRDRNGERYRSAPHLFPYSRFEWLDRHWAPLWTVWSKREKADTGELAVRWFGGAFLKDVNAAGQTRRKLNLVVWSRETRSGPELAFQSRSRILGGLVTLTRQADGSHETKWFWRRPTAAPPPASLPTP